MFRGRPRPLPDRPARGALGPWLCATLGLVFCVVSDARAADPVELPGRVFDERGGAVASAEASLSWIQEGDALRPQGGAVADAEGRFRLLAVIETFPAPLLTMSADRTKGAFDLVERPDLVRGVKVHLGPLMRLSGELRSPGVKRPLTDVQLTVAAHGTAFLHARLRSTQFAVALPEGQYTVTMTSPATEPAVEDVTLQSGRDLDLGVLHARPHEVETAYGEEAPPLTVAEARGAEKDFSWAAYRGRWVLLAFWSSESESSTHSEIPRLLEFWERHAADRTRFQILAFHDETAPSLAALDKRLEALSQDVWDGKDLPFPILLDPSGETVKRFGLKQVPATFLIDPQGRLIPNGSLDKLDATLAETDPDVGEIASALREAKDEATAGPLLERLVAKKSRVASAALLEYAKLGRRETMEATYRALARSGDEEAIAFLVGVDGVRSKISVVQQAAVAALEAANDPRTADSLLAVVLDRSVMIRTATMALRALDRIAPTNPRVLHHAIDFTRHPIAEMRETGVPFLGRVQTRESYMRLVELLQKDTVPAVRAAAATALGRSAEPKAKEVLKKAAAKDNFPVVREAAAKALVELEKPR